MAQQKKSLEEEKALENALSPIINRLIDNNFENSGDKIAKQIAPLIGGAIREQIKSQKDDVVDALYPVMGNMISKFVTKSLEELLAKINTQIQNGLSIAALKRKLKAKIKGVSETELLLEENTQADIKAVLLIHKESGALLCKVEKEDANINDTDMLASMMSAIRSFVNQWVQTNAPYHELGEIEFGGNKIVLEASGYSYLAVIVEGAVYTKTYEKIRHALESVVYEFGEDIQHFSGNFETFPQQAIEEKLKPLLTQMNEEEEKKKTHPLLILLPILLLIWIGYISYKNYEEKQLLTTVQEKIASLPALSLFNIHTSVDDGNVTLQAKVPFPYYKELLKKSVAAIQGVRAINDKIVVVPTLTDPMQTSANISYLIKGFNLGHKSNITYKYDYKTLTLFGDIRNKQDKKELLALLQTLPGVKNIHDNIHLVVPKIDTPIYFDKARSILNENAKASLAKIADTIKKANLHQTIELLAYSDLIGSKKGNTVLAQKRIQNIEQYLRKMYIQNPIEKQVLHQAPPGVNVKQNPDKARCVVIKLKQKNK